MRIKVNELPEQAQKVLVLFPEFQISDFNDSGANGFVMLGRHDVLRKDVALKIYFHSEGEIDQEPAIISSINHENVLKVYDARKIEADCSFYMMPSANSGDLSVFLTNYHISLHLAHRILCQLLFGLSALHNNLNKIVHRDLKPENLLVHDDTLVIADFGSVRRIDEHTGKAPASKHSILYRPPESFGGEAYFDFSSDVYQAGLIGFLLFGGELSNDLLRQLNTKELKQFEKVTAQGGDYEVSVFIDSCIEKRIMSGAVIDWNTLPFYVPNKVKAILKRAVSAKEKRYQTVSEFLGALSKVRASLPNWMPSEGSFTLQNWKGVDYLLAEEKGKISVKKKRSGNITFRTDKSFIQDTYQRALLSLKEKIGLP